MTKKLLGIAVLSILIISSLVVTYMVLNHDDEQREQAHYNLIEPVNITSDVELDQFISDHQFIGNGSQNNPYIIENIHVNQSVDISVLFQDTTRHIVLRNSLIENGMKEGIFLNRVENIIIEANILRNHTGDAVFVNGSRFIRITENSIQGIKFLAAHYDHQGIIDFALSVDVAYSSNVIVRKNQISDSFDGIWFWKGVSNSSILDNQIYNLTQHGIGFGWGGISVNNIPKHILIAGNIIEDVSYGIWVVGSTGGSVIRNNTFIETRIAINALASSDLIENNTILESDYGISYYLPRGNPPGWGNNNSIRFNTIINSTREGLNLVGYNNQVVFNNFIDNHPGRPQITDKHGSNMIEHNYYNEWISPDHDGDGIVDVPYQIYGEGNNWDKLPLTTRVE